MFRIFGFFGTNANSGGYLSISWTVPLLSMTLNQFTQSLSTSKPPEKLSALLEAMWYDAHGDWSKAHEIAQDIETPQGAWVHAFLHRKEGDTSNAEYWYRRAGKSFPPNTLQEEFIEIVSFLLTQP